MGKIWVVTIVFILIILMIGLATSFIFFKKPVKSSGNGGGTVIENPMKQIVIKNTNSAGEINQQAVIDEGIKEFNSEYINYILLALGIGNLQKSIIFGNPVVELTLDSQVWSSEIKNNALYTVLGANDNSDLKITMSKQEAVKALLSSDIKQFMKDSVSNGNTKIEMIAGKPELLAKGYLDMYNKLKS